MPWPLELATYCYNSFTGQYQWPFPSHPFHVNKLALDAMASAREVFKVFVRDPASWQGRDNELFIALSEGEDEDG